jgi:hypothetical protein
MNNRKSIERHMWIRLPHYTFKCVTCGLIRHQELINGILTNKFHYEGMGSIEMTEMPKCKNRQQ